MFLLVRLKMIYTDSNQKHDLRDYQKTKDNNIKMNKKQLKQFNRKFRCFPGGVYLRKTDKPCQENDIKQFISTLLKAERKEIIEMIEKENGSIKISTTSIG